MLRGSAVSPLGITGIGWERNGSPTHRWMSPHSVLHAPDRSEMAYPTLYRPMMVGRWWVIVVRWSSFVGRRLVTQTARHISLFVFAVRRGIRDNLPSITNPEEYATSSLVHTDAICGGFKLQKMSETQSRVGHVLFPHKLGTSQAWSELSTEARSLLAKPDRLSVLTGVNLPTYLPSIAELHRTGRVICTATIQLPPELCLLCTGSPELNLACQAHGL